MTEGEVREMAGCMNEVHKMEYESDKGERMFVAVMLAMIVAGLAVAFAAGYVCGRWM